MTQYTISTDADGLRWIAAIDARGEAHDLVTVLPGESVIEVVEDLLAAGGTTVLQEERQALRALAVDAD